jgi:micrococcal nuclease
LADFYAPELHDPGGAFAKRQLVSLGLGRKARCTAVRGDHGRFTSYDRVIAVCRIKGQSLVGWLQHAGVAQGGHGWPRQMLEGKATKPLLRLA